MNAPRRSQLNVDIITPPARNECTLVQQESVARCILNMSYGCTPTGVWVKRGCRGRFELENERIACGFRGMDGRSRFECALVGHEHARPSASTPRCVCQNERIESTIQCARPRPNATWACAGGTRGGSLPDCCAYDERHGCPSGWEPCAWHSGERIGWVHTPKTGTTFLLSLALLANRSLPLDAGVKALAKGTIQFFKRFPFTTWFQGSSPFWLTGVTHAPVSIAYEEFEGRLFALFRDPRERGWSAYNEFVAKTEQHASMPPEEYARCIAGTQVAMVTTSRRQAPYTVVDCHYPRVVGSSGALSCRRGCGRLAPDMELARRRLQDGFAF
eukprot:4034306-Prymnesium_polylepis.1